MWSCPALHVVLLLLLAPSWVANLGTAMTPSPAYGSAAGQTVHIGMFPSGSTWGTPGQQPGAAWEGFYPAMVYQVAADMGFTADLIELGPAEFISQVPGLLNGTYDMLFLPPERLAEDYPEESHNLVTMPLPFYSCER